MLLGLFGLNQVKKKTQNGSWFKIEGKYLIKEDFSQFLLVFHNKVGHIWSGTWNPEMPADDDQWMVHIDAVQYCVEIFSRTFPAHTEDEA
jgi:hypothetical protein